MQVSMIISEIQADVMEGIKVLFTEMGNKRGGPELRAKRTQGCTGSI